MKKRALSLLTLIAMLVSIIGITIPLTVSAEPNVLAHYAGAEASNTAAYGWDRAWHAPGELTGVGETFGFSTNVPATAQDRFVRHVFANDKLSSGSDSVNGLVLNDTEGVYVYEAEFLPMGLGVSYFDYKFTGNDNKEIVTLRLNADSVLMKNGVNVPGANNNRFNWTSASGTQGFAVANSGRLAVGYMKFVFDFRKHTLSAWLVQRKTGTGSAFGGTTTYSAIQPTDANHLLIKDYKFEDDITALVETKVNSNMTGTSTRGIGYTFIKISQIPGQDIVDEAAAAFSHPDFTDVIDDITLPTTFSSTDVSWVSDEPTYMADDGTLLELPIGADLTLTMTPTFTRGSASAQGTPVNVTLLDGSKVNATVTPETESFDKNIKIAADIDVAFDQGDWAFSAIKNGGTTLVEDTDYTVDGNVYTIKKEYLAGLAVGTAELTFEATGGIFPVVSIAISDTTPVTALYRGLTATEDISAKTVTVTGNGVNDVIDMRDSRDNYMYKLATLGDNYVRLNSRSQINETPAINLVNFYNVFDGFMNTTAPLNARKFSSTKTSREPVVMAFDLGEEKHWNELFIQFNSDDNAQKISNWEIWESNNHADFENIHFSVGDIAKAYVPNLDKGKVFNWNLVYASKPGETLGGDTVKTNAKLELADAISSRYILLFIREVTSSNDDTFNQSWAEIACYLRDVESDEYKIDYSNQIIEVDGIADGISSAEFLSNIKENSNNMSFGVFEDADALNPVTGDISVGNYLVTYDQSSSIVRAYEITTVLPRVTGGGLSTVSGSDVGGTVQVDYDFNFSGSDDSIITWYSDGEEVQTGADSTYTIKVSDVGKMITAVITPKSGSLIGVPFTSQERGSGFPPIIGGNVLEGLDAAKMTTTAQRGTSYGSVAVNNWTTANLKNMLDGNGQFTFKSSTDSNAVGRIIFSVKLNQPRYLNTVNMAFTGTAFKTVKVEGKLNGSYGKDQNGGNVTAPLFNIDSSAPSAGGAIDPYTDICAPTLVDELLVTADMSNVRYTNGLLYFEAFCDVDDEVAVALDGQALALLGGFENINSKITIPDASEGIMYSSIEYDFSNVIGELIDANGNIIFDGISAKDEISIVCKRGEEEISTTVPFSILNTNLYKITDAAFNANNVEIEDAGDLGSIDKNANITLTGNIARNVPGNFKISVLVAGYDVSGKLEDAKVVDITAANSTYSLDCGQFLQGKNIAELKVFAWEMNTMLPFTVEGDGLLKKKID